MPPEKWTLGLIIILRGLSKFGQMVLGIKNRKLRTTGYDLSVSEAGRLMERIFQKERADNHFQDPEFTANGQPRAKINFSELSVLWFNTGTICNLTCRNCFMESSPTNDGLTFLKLNDVQTFLDEIVRTQLPVTQIGFTGGEPFINPDLIAMIELCLNQNYEVLILTNAMKPMMKEADKLQVLRNLHKDKLKIRVSLDHYTRKIHESERGLNTWPAALDGLVWLSNKKFTVRVAGRQRSLETETKIRDGYAKLFQSNNIRVNAHEPMELILFPEMNFMNPVQEITEQCWKVLPVNPDDIMCSHSRMVIKRKGSDIPVLMACTLITDDANFELGSTLKESQKEIPLNHPYCSQFCVLGAATCSGS